MKRFLFIILLFIPIFIYADTTPCRAIGFSYKYPNSNWSNWKEVNIVVTISDTHLIIYSNDTQVYKAINNGRLRNISGQEEFAIKCIDQDGVICTVRMVLVNKVTGYSQIYIDYDNISFCYIITF